MATPRELAERVADEAMATGARAVWLGGSVARGEAGPHSDVDLGAIVDMTPKVRGPRLRRIEGRLVSLVHVTRSQTRESFRHPALLGAAVPGWRRAVVLRDPQGLARELRQEALAWDWDPELEARCDRFVARELVFLAEYAHKMRGCLERDARLAAAAHRNLLVGRLALAVSVHRRLLYDSENALHAWVAEDAGEPWASTHACALGLGRESLEATCAAALQLFAFAADATSTLLDEEQAAIALPAADLAR